MDNNNKEFSKSYLKKLERKQLRAQKRIEEEAKIKCIHNPTTNLMICNTGLVNGFSQEQLVTLFSPFGQIKETIMIPGKSYCFIIFYNIENSLSAYNAIHGKVNMAQDNNPLCLSYVETAPNLITTAEHSTYPSGLLIFEDFVTEQEEQNLLSCLNWDNTSESALKYRKVQHFGYEFCYDINNVKKDSPLEQKIPSECMFISERLYERGFKKKFNPDQLTVNMYQPGQGIPPHIDTHSAFEDPILSLSLGSSVVMDFKHRDGRTIPVLLPRRSLLIMSEEARYDWIHGIVPRTMDVIRTDNGLTVQKRDVRISFTFRKILHGECECTYVDECDSAKKRLETSQQIDNHKAVELEKSHVHDVYDAISSHFNDTRQKPWPNVLEFVLSFDTGALLVDVGCGNGKYLSRNRNIFNIGCDRSQGLLEVCRDKQFEIFQCDCLYLPLRSNIADGCISIAVIHHLANEERRLQAIEEIVRVLKLFGKALIYVWAKDQTKDDEKSSYLKQDRKNRRKTNENITNHISEQIFNSNEKTELPVHLNRTEFKHKDMLVPWKLKNSNLNSNSDSDSSTPTFLRYYHIFDEGELEQLCLKLNNINILKSYYDQGNWCVILEKNKL